MYELDREGHIAAIVEDCVRHGADPDWARANVRARYDELCAQATVDTFVPVLVRRAMLEALRAGDRSTARAG